MSREDAVDRQELETVSPAGRIRYGIGRLAMLALGAVFLLAGGLKALDPQAFTEQVREHAILPEAAAPLAAYFMITLEMALGASLVAGFHRRLSLGVAVALLVGFLGLMARAWSRGGDISSCGCFGNFVERTPAETIMEDLLFLGLAGLGFLVPRRTPSGGWIRAGAVVTAALATVAFIPLAPSLPLDNLVTSLKPGARLADLHLSLPDAAFTDGRYLVALLALESEESGEAAEELSALAASPGAPRIAVIHADPPEVEDAFFWTHAPAYPMYEVLHEEMRGLYRRLPRFFLLEGGVVRQVWESVPPAEAVIARDLLHEDASQERR